MEVMSILEWCIVGLCLIFGFLGCFINKFPGPVCVVIALLVAKYGLDMPFENGTMWGVIAVAIASIFVSKFLTKIARQIHEFSKRGSLATTIGSLVGLAIIFAAKDVESAALILLIIILAMVGLPFVLAYLLELTKKQGNEYALKAATSATATYLADTVLKIGAFYLAIKVIFGF